MSFLVHHIKNWASKRVYHLILHFFFRNGSTESPVTMVATLIDQLIEQNPTKEFVELLHEKRLGSGKNTCSDLDHLWEFFIELMRKYTGTIYILIDALDECNPDERSEILKKIRDTKWLDLGVNMVVTTRAEHDILKIVKDTDSKIDLASQAVEKDIELFVREQLETEEYAPLQPFKSEILAVLPEKSQRMFRYAALVLHELRENTDPTKTVEEILSLMPSGLNGIYEWILSHLAASTLPSRRTILLWVALAERPLSVEEIGLACASPAKFDLSKEFDPTKCVLMSGDRIRKACGPLIEITFKGEVRFTHFSVKEFLLNDSSNATSNPPMSTSVTECLIPDLGLAHMMISRTCCKCFPPDLLGALWYYT